MDLDTSSKVSDSAMATFQAPGAVNFTMHSNVFTYKLLVLGIWVTRECGRACMCNSVQIVKQLQLCVPPWS